MIPLSVRFEGIKASVLCSLRVTGESRCVYATREDFCNLFMEDWNSLYLLSFLLTANHEQAEQCFVAGLDDCVDGCPAFHHWSHSWARSVIVRNAIQVMRPHAGPEISMVDLANPMASRRPLKPSAQDGCFAGVLALEALERFVFVLSVLERYPDQSCALLLEVSQLEVREARVRALDHMADFDTGGAMPPTDLVTQA